MKMTDKVAEASKDEAPKEEGGKPNWFDKYKKKSKGDDKDEKKDGDKKDDKEESSDKKESMSEKVSGIKTKAALLGTAAAGAGAAAANPDATSQIAENTMNIVGDPIESSKRLINKVKHRAKDAENSLAWTVSKYKNKMKSKKD